MVHAFGVQAAILRRKFEKLEPTRVQLRAALPNAVVLSSTVEGNDCCALYVEIRGLCLKPRPLTLNSDFGFSGFKVRSRYLVSPKADKSNNYLKPSCSCFWRSSRVCCP